jgi:hypothetical protein
MIKKSSLIAFLPMMVWLFFGIFSLRYGLEIFNGGNGWKTGDWLINYSDGFIRRGFLGSLVYWISGFGISLLWLVYLMQVSIYALMLSFVLKLYKSADRSLYWLLILFSPAFLLFPFYDFKGGFRKEILVLTLFAFFSLSYAQASVSIAKVTWVVVFYFLAGLSHEVTIFVLPFFLYMLWQSVETNQLEKKYGIIFSIALIGISFSILLMSYVFKGSEGSASVICNSLTERSLTPDICNGAISWLTEDSHSAFYRVIEGLGWHSLSVFQFVVLAFVPTIFTTFWNKRTLVLFVVSFVFITPLFAVAIDWGRWIYIFAFMFYCVLLSSRIVVNVPFRLSYLIAGFIYLTTWSIPHCCTGGGVGTGLMGFVARVSKLTLGLMM